MSASTRIKSLPSREGAFVIDVKEIKSIRATYEYQFYVANERALRANDIQVSPDYSIVSRNTPSYLKVEFEKPNFIETDNEDNNITFAASEATLDSFFSRVEILDENIFSENDFGGNLFTGIKSSIPNEISIIRDIIKESTEVLIQPEKSSSETLNNSTTDFIRSFANTANTENFLFSRQSKKMLDKFFTNISTEGLGKTSENKDIPFLGYSFTGNFNSVILNDIEKSASENSTSIFSNSIADVKAKLSEIQNNAISKKTDIIPLSNYYPSFDSNKIITDNTANSILFGSTQSDFQLETQTFRNIRHVGYRVNVRVIDSQGTVFNLNPAIFKNPDISEIFITNLPYDGQASVFIEPVYAIKIPVIKETVAGNQSVSGIIFVAGSGKSVVTNIVDVVPPPPPQDLKFNVTDTGLEISWSLPFNTQRDITKFRVYRRKSKNEPFTLLRQISFDPVNDKEIPSFLNEVLPPGNVKTFYTDYEFDSESKYVYAVSAIDVHGLASNYSEQIHVSINPVFNTLETKLFARIGAFLSYPNATIEEQTFTDVVKSSGYSKLKVYFNPDFLRVYKRLEGDIEEDLLNINPDKQKRFKINLINLDLQQNQNIDIIITEGINISPFDSEDSAVVRSFLETNN